MKKSIIFILFLLSISYAVFGQMTVSGKVVDESGESLPAATVGIKGTIRETITDIDGNFSIVIENEDDTLIFSFIGFEPKEIKGSEVPKEIVLRSYDLVECYIGNYYYTPLVINYWSGIFYNPYGISISKGWHYLPILNSTYLSVGYSTNFKNNQDFYARIGTKIFKRTIYYTFQNTDFNCSNTKKNIKTHLLESSSNIKIVNLLYSLGYQTFKKKGLENSKKENYGVALGLLKQIYKIDLFCSLRSFYWQDYWAWEANLNKSIYYKKIRLNTAISYRQTTQDFKEVNLSLGYIF